MIQDYEYIDILNGALVVITKDHTKADRIDSVIRYQGRRLKRIASSPRPQHAIVAKDERRTRHNIAKGMPGFEHYDKKGYPVASNAELRNKGFVENPHLDDPRWKDDPSDPI